QESIDFEAPEFTALLERAQAAVQAGQPAEVLQANGEIDRLLSDRRHVRHQEEQRRTLEKARSAATKFIMVKKLIMDLRKADIDITGAEESLRAAEHAIEDRNFDDVDVILTDLDATAKELMNELVAASRNLIGRAERKIHEGRDAGLEVEKAVAHLDTAEAAFQRGEYADAVEHARAAEKEVAEGLRELKSREAEARRRAQEAARSELAAIRKTISDLARADISIYGADAAPGRAKVGAHAKFGADVRTAAEILARAEAMIDAGELHEVGGYAKRISEEVELARKAHLGSVVGSFSPMVEEGVSLGLHEEELEEYRAHAEDAAAADDLEAVYRLRGDLQERLLDAKRHQIVKRSMDEIQSLEELVTQSERLGVPSVAARGHLQGARKAIEEGNVDGFER